MSETNSLVRTAKTVEEAIELATLELGVGRAEVEVDVISRGRAGILGLGAEPAKVRVTRIDQQQEGLAGAALHVVSALLRDLDVEARPTIRSSGDAENPPIIDIQGEDAGLIIGHRGETLRSLQFIVNLVLSRQQGKASRVVIDVEEYRERHQRQLTGMAQRTASRVISSGRPATLEPMSAADRRVIHVTLSDNQGVTTRSSGEGNQRRVTITPTGPATGGGAAEPGNERNPRGGRRYTARRRAPRTLDDNFGNRRSDDRYLPPQD